MVTMAPIRRIETPGSPP